MFNSKIAIIRTDKYKYPDRNNFLKLHNNHVYRVVSECLKLLELDKEHYGTPEWNPMARYISPGNRVLLKPNMVLNKNRQEENGTDCLITNPSVVAAILEYAVKAGGKDGIYIIGDAPLSDCDFNKLIKETGYDNLIESYKKRGYDVRLVDFRNVKIIKKENGIRYNQDDEHEDNGIVVSLGSLSAFYGLSEERLSKLRVTDYDPRIIVRHHTKQHHEYMVAKELLKADTVINLPKPKTHRKAGITAALKNMVGINANKEYLPHHTLGSKDEGGDDFEKKNDALTEAEKLLDERNILNEEGKIKEAQEKAKDFSDKFREGQRKELYFEGSWYGNDTIWRTIVDLNKILYYADKNGIIRDNIQRKVFNLGDMIISGSGEGPLAPEPVNCGIIIGGEDPLLFDRTVCSIMGFDYQKISLLNDKNEQILRGGKCALSGCKKLNIVSNDERYNGKSLKEISEIRDCIFTPSFGWQKALGNSYYDQIKGNIVTWENFIHTASLNNKSNIYIFGAGAHGIEIYELLKKEGISITCFIDNDINKHNSRFYDGISCTSLENCMSNSYFIVSILSLSTRIEIAFQINKRIPDSSIVFH